MEIEMKFGNFVATMESMGVEPVSDMELEENSTEVAEAVTEVAEAGNKVDEINTAIGDATDAVDTITKAQEIVESKEGDLTPAEQATMESLYAGVMNRLSLSVDRATLESNSNSRADWVATLESEKEGLLSRIWKAIKAMLGATLGFIGNLLKNKKMLAKHVDDLLEKAKAAPFFAGGKEISGQFVNFGHAGSAVRSLQVLAAEIQDAANLSKRASALIMKIENSSDDSLDKFNEVKAETESIIQKIGTLGNLPKDKFAKNETLFVGTDSKNTLRKTVSTLDGLFDGKSVSLSKAEVVTLLTHTQTACKELNSLTGLEGAVRTFFGSIKDNALSKINKRRAENGDSKAPLLSIMYSMKSIARLTTRDFGTFLGSFIFKNIKALADYAKASLAVGLKPQPAAAA